MSRLSGRIRGRLSYATVVSAISVFIVLFGGAALAANQLAKNSVGKKQLKANSVTTAKIKKNAVTAAKIRAGAIDGAKVKDASLGSAALNLADMPGQRIVHKAAAAGPLSVGTATPVLFPFDAPTYTQVAGQDDFYYGAVTISFDAGCTVPRAARAFLFVDAANPTDIEGERGNLVAAGEAKGDVGGAETETVRLSSFESSGVRFQSDAPTNHKLALVVKSECKSGSGVTASNAAADVIGIR